MSVIFKKVKYQNLLATGNIPIEIELDKSANTLIVGANGAGKCVHPDTKIDIEFYSRDVYKDFTKFMENRK